MTVVYLLFLGLKWLFAVNTDISGEHFIQEHLGNQMPTVVQARIHLESKTVPSSRVPLKW